MYGTNTSIVSKLCGVYPLWDQASALLDRPVFSPCFEETLLVWIPYGILWAGLVPYVMTLKHKQKVKPLLWTRLQLIKTVFTVALFCLTVCHMMLTSKWGYRCIMTSSAPIAAFLADGAKAISFMVILFLEQYVRMLGIRSSSFCFFVWLSIAIGDIVHVYSVSMAPVWCISSYIYCLRFMIIWIQLCLRCMADKDRATGYHQLNRNPCPDEGVSLINSLTYQWITPFIKKCYNETLTTDDIWQQSKALKSKRVVRALLKNWNASQQALNRNNETKTAKLNDKYSVAYKVTKRLGSDNEAMLGSNFTEIAETEHSRLLDGDDSEDDEGASVGVESVNMQPLKNSRKHPSLFRVMLRTYWRPGVEAALVCLLAESLHMLQPMIVRQIMYSIESRKDTEAEHVPEWIGYASAVALATTSLVKIILWQNNLHRIRRIGLTVKAALIGMIYRKSLTLSNGSKKNCSTGQIMNMMSLDCQKIHDAAQVLQYVLSIPFAIVVSMAQIWSMVGVAMFGGLAVTILCVCTLVLLGRLQQKLQGRIMAVKDKRIKLLHEVLSGIKVLKMYVWEPAFQKSVIALRMNEIQRLRMYGVLNAFVVTIVVQSPFLILYSIIIVYTLVQPIHHISAQTALITMSLVFMLRRSIVQIPWIIRFTIQAYVSTSRIQKFLWMEDMDSSYVNVTEDSAYAINIERASFAWNAENTWEATLENITVQVPEGGLYAVVGPVGAGKSSLISAVLGEMQKLDGNISVKGRIACITQESWIQNMTLRDNITFGSAWNEYRYNKILTGCALDVDALSLAGGDLTEIGEKGLNISGGQKQRIHIARAAYNDADIYLMDDPLSAIDSHVAKQLFNNIIGNKGVLKRKTRLLTTNGIHWLPMVDKILVLTDGRISEAGTYQELISRNGAFANFVQSYTEQNTQADGGSAVSKDGPSCLEDIETTIRRRRHSSTDSSMSLTIPSTGSLELSSPTVESKCVITKVIQDETPQTGSVSFAVIKKYGKAIGHCYLLVLAVLVVAIQWLNIYPHVWLTYWTEDPLMRNISQGHTQAYQDRYHYYVVRFTLLGILQCCASFTFFIILMMRLVHASGVLHNQMVHSVLRSPMSFFDTTPVGRIINRFSSDVDILDDRLPITGRLLVMNSCRAIAGMLLVVFNTPSTAVVISVVLLIYFGIMAFVLPAIRQTKRLESVLRSPIYNHFSETISGASIIRTYRRVDEFIEELDRRMDKHSSFAYAAFSASRWISVRLAYLAYIVVLSVTVLALHTDNINSAQAALSINYTLEILTYANILILSRTNMEMYIVSMERVAEYADLQSEAPCTIASRRPSTDWPHTGTVELQNYQTRYRDGLDLTLKGITCNIESGEKIGIVGRTGAGKSSLVLSLFRLCESAGGAIFLDGQNIADIGLHDLRDKLTILPQDPVIFSGTLRDNLDPFNKFDDERMWRALESAHMKSAVSSMPGQLSYECGEAGSNLSAGQRQLVCLARTLLHKTRILILDEATAAVDLETDDLIQTTIRKEFSDCTILTIAHRINTVLDCDRIMVLSDGRIVEIDTPERLLHDPSSTFYSMAKNTGITL